MLMWSLGPPKLPPLSDRLVHCAVLRMVGFAPDHYASVDDMDLKCEVGVLIAIRALLFKVHGRAVVLKLREVRRTCSVDFRPRRPDAQTSPIQ